MLWCIQFAVFILFESPKTWLTNEVISEFPIFLCLLVKQEECDSEKVAAKLDLYNSSCPHTAQIANYWLCRAKIAQQQNDYDRVVCLFEQALVFKAQVTQLFLQISVCFVLVIVSLYQAFRYRAAANRAGMRPRANEKLLIVWRCVLSCFSLTVHLFSGLEIKIIKKYWEGIVSVVSSVAAESRARCRMKQWRIRT